jgi:hypothetical protein
LRTDSLICVLKNGTVFISYNQNYFMAEAKKREEPPKSTDQGSKVNEEPVIKAHEEAEKDIEDDPDFQSDLTTDLDEGELAQLEGED